MTHRIALVVSIVAALSLPAVASADTTLTLNGPAAKSLRAQGVKIYEQLPARGIGSKIEFPVSGGQVAAKATVEHQGQLRLQRGWRRLILKSVRVVIGPGTQRLSAISGNQRVTLFSIRNGKSKPKLNAAASTARLSGAKLRFTTAGARLLRKKLGKAPSTKLSAGTIKVNAQVPVEPAGFVRPATAVDIQSATITWHLRESLVQYVASNGSITTADGAVPGPAASDGLIYDFTFPVRAGGWWDPVSATANVSGKGTVRFSGHISDSASDPDIELNGSGSRTIFRFGDGKRAVLFGLAPTNPPASPFGPVNVPGFILQGEGQKLFGSFYLPGEEFGYVTVGFTT